MSIALLHARVLTEQGFREDCAVVVEAGRIHALVAHDDACLRGIETLDLSGRILLPGFIDAQVNGGGGVLLNDQPTLEGVRAIAEAHRRFGTTGLLPTLISDELDVIVRAIAAVEAAIAAGVPGVLGIHIEGPYLAPARKGVHDPAHFRVPDADELAKVSALRGGRTLLTLAPERVGPEIISKLVRAGVVVAAGHTAGSYVETRVGLAAGVSGFTHLFNAMTPLGSREPGVVGAALEDPASWCGIIVDGHHVHPASLRMALAAKPRGKVFLVTDAMPPVGSDDPSFQLKGETITVRDGICQAASGSLAGSALDMAQALRNAVSILDLPLDEAARMASTYPADFLGIGHQRGRIRVGAQADFCVLDENLQVLETWIDGQGHVVN